MIRGVAVAVVMFVALGTVAALWSNRLFMRMTPVSGFEVALLLLQSVLAGVALLALALRLKRQHKECAQTFPAA